MEKIILASASPRRREILQQIRIPFEIHPAQGEEKMTASEPSVLVQQLASAKAHEVAFLYEDGIVLGADTIVVCDGQVLGKPTDRMHAKKMIEKLQGRCHEVYTGVCICRKQSGQLLQEQVFAERTLVHVSSMSDDEIDDYIASGEGDDKAGAYGIQGSFAAFIQGIEGDYFNVVGLPGARVYQALKTIITD